MTASTRHGKTPSVAALVVAALVLVIAVAFWSGRQLGRSAAPRIIVRQPSLSRALPLQLTGVEAPVWVEMLSDYPRVMLLHNFLLPAECDYLVQLAEPRMSPSTVQTTFNARSADRTSFTTNLERHETRRVAAIEERAALVSGHPVCNLEPLQVVRYEPGQFYKPHYDYFVPGARGTERAVQRGGQRITTLFVYLNNLDRDDPGGCTAFPKLNLRIRPERGMALLFSNLLSDGTPDTRMLHAGEPPTRSVKYGLNVWFRQRAFP